jgi:hypothetical protein
MPEFCFNRKDASRPRYHMINVLSASDEIVKHMVIVRQNFENACHMLLAARPLKVTLHMAKTFYQSDYAPNRREDKANAPDKNSIRGI